MNKTDEKKDQNQHARNAQKKHWQWVDPEFANIQEKEGNYEINGSYCKQIGC